MGRYVVVEFVDNADADAFVQRLNEENVQNRNMRKLFSRRVVGIFVKPGRTCDCSDWGRANYGDKNWPVGIARGAKFGWWVCTRCNKPRKAGHELANQVMPSETFEGVIFDEYETCVTNLQVSGFHTDQIARPKKLRKKKVK